jgi:acyl carrier protein
MNSEHDIRAQLRNWVLAKNGKIRPEELDDHTPILEQRIISSLQVMDLILFLEQLTGKSLEVEMLQADAFRSIEMLYQHFFAAEVPRAYAH